MAKTMKRLLAAVLAIALCAGIALPAFASELENGNVWYGDQVAVDVTAGTEGYNYMALFRKYVHGYEFGGHFMGDGEGPQTFVAIDTAKYDGTTWKPDGVFKPDGTSNYEVLYCCDVETMIVDSTYYKRVNLDDSEYYTPTEADKIRAIVMNAYPYVSVEEMKQALPDTVKDKENLTRNEIIAAVQTAIWCSANGVKAENMRYRQSYKVADNLQWGYPMHDTSNEPGLDVSGKRTFKTYPEVGERIDGLVDYLLALEPVKANDNQIVITELNIVNSTISNARGLYNVTLNVKLNHGADQNDDIVIEAYVGEDRVASVEANDGTNYSLNLQAAEGAEIKVVVSGTQHLERGVYFYAPKPDDVNGDGIATSREVSQNLVGVSAGDTPVYAEASATIENGKILKKEATPLYDKDFTDVTLSVNGALDYNAGAAVDIVIALGAGIANQANTYESIITLVKPLLEQGINVKLGLIAVEHYDDVAMELTLLTENYEQIIKDGLNTILNMPAGPTNLHGNILAAKAMLDADTAVPAQNKFFYVIGTGRTYNYDNAEGVPTTIINKLVYNGHSYYYWGHYLWQSQRGDHTSCYRVPTSYNNDFAAYWADVEKWVEADGNAYAYSFPNYNTANSQWFNEYMKTNSTDLKAHGIVSSRFGWLITDLTDSGKAAIGSGKNPQNALNYERAQYEAYYAYKAMVDAGYTCQTLCSESVSYQNYSPYMTYLGITPGIQLGHSFMDHMAKLSGQKESTVLFILKDNDGNYEMAQNFFTPIDTTKLVGVGKPATPFVEDFIGFGEDYDFDFTGNLDKLVLKVNGVAYTTNVVAAQNGATASCTFTNAEGKICFTLDYFKGNGTTAERFVWNFLQPLNEDETVTLTYQLKLVKRNEEVGTHKAFTNQSATLYPTGDRNYGQLFPMPDVLYTNYPPLEGEKTSKPTENPDRFEINIEVPGGDAEVKHDEIILMVDGSYSGDTEWPAMKEAIISIGEAVLDGSGHTQLTLMAFGMGDNEVLVHVKTVAELENALGELPGNLLRGVSSTNCEAGFTGVAEYVNNHEGDLKDAVVIYITDGGINTDETPRLFYNWQDYAPNPNNVISYALDGVELPEGITYEQKVALVNELWSDVFALSGMDVNKEYPISEMERAFLVYVEEYGRMGVYYSFLMAMKNSKFDKYPDVRNRTYNSVFELAKLEEVKDLYLVRYQNDGRATWMVDAAAVSQEDKIHYVKSDSITTLTSALESAVDELSKTPYNDVVITDYMSKWVNIDLSTLQIRDITTNTIIWTYANGWQINENRPTAQEVPVKVEVVAPADYEAGGEHVIGNTSGDIYKLTWYVKDGTLLRSDNYRIEYEVTIDTAEEGFQYGVSYPANGTTEVGYGTMFGTALIDEIIVDIEVPEVVIEKPETITISFESGEASNISFMLIDKATGEVTFLYKIDIGGQTSFEIPAEEGKISAVFVKQSTSGMFWFAEEVDAETQQAVIDCLKANNRSYKGHNAIAFGEGEHDLEFKKGKFVTYIFGSEEVETEESEKNNENNYNDNDKSEDDKDNKNDKNNKNNKNNKK